MNINKSETLGFGVINLGIAFIFGLWQGWLSGIIMFVVMYTIIGMFQKWDTNIPMWNWFFHGLKNS